MKVEPKRDKAEEKLLAGMLSDDAFMRLIPFPFYYCALNNGFELEAKTLF